MSSYFVQKKLIHKTKNEASIFYTFIIRTNQSFAQCSDFDLSFSIIHPLCFHSNKGYISTSITGGLEPYNYEILSESDEVVNESGENFASDLFSGIYSLTITDADGCDTTVSINLYGPTQLHFSDFWSENGVPGEYCFLSMSDSGGTADYDYLWTSVDNPEFSSINSTIGIL